MNASITRITKILLGLATLLVGATAICSAADQKIVLVAGRPSHPAGEHEFRAGALLLQLCLNRIPGIQAVVITNGWPTQVVDGQTADLNSAFDGAAAVVFFMDGGSGHPVVQRDHLKVVAALAQKGVGLGFYHYAVEVPLNNGGQEFLEWLGGFYENNVSTNPVWEADIKSLPAHAITRGVKPFSIRDEWYFNIHFRSDMKGITPILVAKPSDVDRQGATSSPRGPHAHIVAAIGREEVLAWAFERPDGGRSFGFDGAHFHTNWANPDFRKLALNSLFWLAKIEVPANGVESLPSTPELQQNLDPKPARGAGAGVVTIPNVTKASAVLGSMMCISALEKYAKFPSIRLSSMGRPVIHVGFVRLGSNAPPLGRS